MTEKPPTTQWQLVVTVFHSANFGHSISISTKSRGREWKYYPGGTWKGLGVPEPVINALLASVQARLTEHLTTRYGVAGELPLKWGGEPDPF